MRLACVFPGQGAQSVGMLRELPRHAVVQSTLQEAMDCLGRGVAAMDSEEALAGTVGTQVAMVVAGVAFGRFLVSEGVALDAVAGMSVGQYAAAVIAGCLELPAALHLVQRRAELMEAAFPGGEYGMAVVEGLPLVAVQKLMDGFDVSIANYNTANQYVLAGRRDLLSDVVRTAIDAGAHRARLLQMAVASHTEKLRPFAEKLYRASQDVAIAAPKVAMYANRSARRLVSAEAVCDELAWNMAQPVRWRDTLEAIQSYGVDCFVEAPPGHTLTHLCQAVLPEAKTLAATDMRWDVLVHRLKQMGD